MDACLCYSFLLCLLISMIMLLLLVSMDSLEPLQIGIAYNKITKTIDNHVYDSGRYLIGPLKGFIIYPSNLVTIEFSDSRGAISSPLQTRTAEGLAISLHVSFQYKLMRNEIPKLYNLTGIAYQATFVRISRDVILKVASLYNATNYWTQRLKIGNHMHQALDSELKTAFASCEGIQILKIDLPKPYEDSIVQTQVEVQKTSMRKFEQTAELIRQNISVLRSEAEMRIRITNATASAEAYRIKQFAIATANNKTIHAETHIYKNVVDVLGIKEKELINYLFLNNLNEQHNAKILVGLQNSIVNFGNQPAQSLRSLRTG